MQCDDRARHIQAIMALEKDVQAELMAEIESILAFTATLPAPDDQEENEGEYDESDDARSRCSASTPRNVKTPRRLITPASTIRSFDGGARAKRLQREVDALKGENEELLSENRALQAQLDASRSEAQEARQRSEAAASSKARALQRGSDEREETLRDQLEDANARAEKLSAELAAANKTVARSQSLRDEIDVLRASAAKADRLAETVAKQRRALEDFAEMKKSAKQRQEKNAAIKEDLKKAEAAASKATKAERELDAYRSSLTEAEVELGELRAAVRAKDEAIARLEGRAMKRAANERAGDNRAFSGSPRSTARWTGADDATGPIRALCGTKCRCARAHQLRGRRGLLARVSEENERSLNWTVSKLES